MRRLLVLAAVAAGLWVVVLRADDGSLQTFALAGVVTAGVLIGLSGAPRRAIVVAVLIAIVFLVVPTAGNPAQHEGSCDPFCDSGGTLLIAFGPMALLALPFAIAPTLVGVVIRLLRESRRREST
ncbi:MAG: hypothetical protein ACRDLS_06355 [Solirubrobacteraceae bacterium]